MGKGGVFLHGSIEKTPDDVREKKRSGGTFPNFAEEIAWVSQIAALILKERCGAKGRGQDSTNDPDNRFSHGIVRKSQRASDDPPDSADDNGSDGVESGPVIILRF